MARLEIVYKKRKWMPMIPHRLWINDRLLGVIQNPQVNIDMSAGVYKVKIQSMIPFLSSTADIKVEEGVRNVFTFCDEEKVWDTIFCFAMIMEFAHIFLQLSPLQNLIYHVIDDGMLIVWLIYEWRHRRYYYSVNYSHFKITEEEL